MLAALRTFQEALKKMATFTNWAIVIVLAILTLWVVVRFLILCVERFLPSAEITLAPFEISVTNLKLAADSAPKILSAKLQTFRQQAKAKPTGYGFLDIPVVTAVPLEARTRQTEVLDKIRDLDLKVKDVDISKLLKVVNAALEPNKTELQGRITELAETIEIQCELVSDGKVIKAWGSSRRKQKDAANDAVVFGLLDDIIFQMIYDIPRDPALRDRFGASKGQTADDIPNWKALQAFNQGVGALEEYRQDLNYDALRRAIEQLKRLPVIAPDYGLGLYFYGLALAEDRQEAAASDVFDSIQRTRASDLVKTEARFQHAAALLRFYSAGEAERAVRVLDELISDLEKRRTNAEGKDRAYYTKLLSISHAQRAYTYGTMIVLSRNQKYYGKVEPDIRAAKAAYGEVSAEDWVSDREKDDVQFRINNAAGYSLFRYAQLDDPNQLKDRCNTAIALLNEADRARPNHYEVLQNLAMIYDDEFYDPTGAFLDTAERLYQTTLNFVPGDYYQYERLARIQWRRLEHTAGPDQRVGLAKKGKQYAEMALEKRPQSKEALWLSARFDAELWRQETDEAARSRLATQAEKKIGMAIKAGFRNGPLMLDCAEFLLDAASGATASAYKDDAQIVLQGAKKALDTASRLIPAQAKRLHELQERLRKQ